MRSKIVTIGALLVALAVVPCCGRRSTSQRISARRSTPEGNRETPKAVARRDGLLPPEGSALAVTADGCFVTAQHVVDGARRIQLTMGSQTREATLVREAAGFGDLALLRADGLRAQPLALASPDRSMLGWSLLACGYPEGHGDGPAVVNSGRLTGGHELLGVPYIVTDAAATPGMSGGPLATPDAVVIGVLTQGTDTRAKGGYAWATSAALVKEMLQKAGVSFRAGLPSQTASRSSGIKRLQAGVALLRAEHSSEVSPPVTPSPR